MMRIPCELPTLCGERLRLRPPRPDDAVALAAAFVADPDLGRLAGEETDPDEARVRERLEKAAARAAAGQALTLTLADVETDACLGSFIAFHFEEQHRRCELGFYLVPEARGRGLATKGARVLIDWLFGDVGLERVEMCTTSDNPTVPALADRLGFTYEGTARARNRERGVRVDLLNYGLLNHEWR